MKRLTLTICLALCAGCAGVKSAVRQPLIVTTNVTSTVVEVPAKTTVVRTGITAVETPQGIQFTTNYTETIKPAASVTNRQTNITVAVNPALTQTLEIASEANRLVNPTPAAPFVELGLVALTGILGILARWKQSKLQREIEAHNKTNDLLEAVINGVEVAKQPETKQAIANVAKQWKVARELDSKVQDTVNPS
jgi:hypothetical protein